MNSAPAPNSTPGLYSLYWRDFTIRYALNAIGFGLMVAVGMAWATQWDRSALDAGEAAFEAACAKWALVGGLVLAAVAALVLTRRYLWVTKVLNRGSTIKGTVEKTDVHTWEKSGSATTPAFRRPTRRAYWATIRYEMHGRERKVRLKLPNSGFTYGLVKGGETDLLALESAPHKPLIRAVYLGRF